MPCCRRHSSASFVASSQPLCRSFVYPHHYSMLSKFTYQHAVDLESFRQSIDGSKVHSLLKCVWLPWWALACLLFRAKNRLDRLQFSRAFSKSVAATYLVENNTLFHPLRHVSDTLLRLKSTAFQSNGRWERSFRSFNNVDLTPSVYHFW